MRVASLPQVLQLQGQVAHLTARLEEQGGQLAALRVQLAAARATAAGAGGSGAPPLANGAAAVRLLGLAVGNVTSAAAAPPSLQACHHACRWACNITQALGD